MKKWIIGAISICTIAAVAVAALVPCRDICNIAALPARSVGDSVDALNGVPVYFNGLVYTESFGTHYAEDGYYYGKKWQCVEFIKRYYHDELKHNMPDVYGHARDFFDTSLQQGEYSKTRNLFQYRNGDNVAPKVNDLLVFTDSKYGHVAIVSNVTDSEVEVVQQNILYKPREVLPLKKEKGLYTLGDDWQPAGWLRKQ